MGILLILSQIIPRKIDVTKYLKISIVIGSVLLILGNLLEVVFRLQMGIKLNTVFCSMTNTMSSTSILHTHLLKSILGEVITKIMGPFVQSNINTGVGLYSYVPTVGFLIILLIPVLFITLTFANQKRPWPTAILLSFCHIGNTISLSKLFTEKGHRYQRCPFLFHTMLFYFLFSFF